MEISDFEQEQKIAQHSGVQFYGNFNGYYLKP